MVKLNVDSNKKSIEMELMLLGEKEPITVKIGNYELSQKDGKFFLMVKGVSTSRAWLNTVASTYLEGKEFELPAHYAKLLKTLL